MFFEGVMGWVFFLGDFGMGSFFVGELLVLIIMFIFLIEVGWREFIWWWVLVFRGVGVMFGMGNGCFGEILRC